MKKLTLLILLASHFATAADFQPAPPPEDVQEALLAALKNGRNTAAMVEYIDAIATGETWYGAQAVENHLIDAIGTSDDYILAHLHSHQLVQLEEHVPERWLDKIKHRFLGKIQARPLKARIR